MKRDPDPDVAAAMEITALCDTFHTLPRSGGLFDQDSLLVHMMREVLTAQREKAEMER